MSATPFNVTDEPVLYSTGIENLLPMVRLPGRHVSSAIRRAAIALGHFEDSETTDADNPRFQMGLAFEDAVASALAARYARHYPDRFCRLPSLELDGIVGNLDLFDTIDVVPVEIKLSKLSSNQSPSGKKFWSKWAQVMAYAHMLGLDVGRLVIAHVNGDYRDDRDYKINIWQWKWPASKLESNWDMVKVYAVEE